MDRVHNALRGSVKTKRPTGRTHEPTLLSYFQSELYWYPLGREYIMREGMSQWMEAMKIF
jgi:hypothetical protein